MCLALHWCKQGGQVGAQSSATLCHNAVKVPESPWRCLERGCRGESLGWSCIVCNATAASRLQQQRESLLPCQASSSAWIASPACVKAASGIQNMPKAEGIQSAQDWLSSQGCRVGYPDLESGSECRVMKIPVRLAFARENIHTTDNSCTQDQC